jgi:hypothetical protein
MAAHSFRDFLDSIPGSKVPFRAREKGRFPPAEREQRIVPDDALSEAEVAVPLTRDAVVQIVNDALAAQRRPNFAIRLLNWWVIGVVTAAAVDGVVRPRYFLVATFVVLVAAAVYWLTARFWTSNSARPHEKIFVMVVGFGIPILTMLANAFHAHHSTLAIVCGACAGMLAIVGFPVAAYLDDRAGVFDRAGVTH